MILVKNKTILSDQFCWRLCSPHSYIVDGRTLDHEPKAHFQKHAVELEGHAAALLASLRPSERHFSDGLRGSHEEALRREIREELEVDVNVGDLIDTIEYDYPTFHLSMKCFACTIAGGSPHLLEHEAAKWLTSMQLGSVDWLPADVTLIPKIETMLEG